MTTIQEKKNLLQVKKDEVRQLEQEIAQLTLEEQEQEEPSLAQSFPVGATVKFIGKREKYRLRGKKAVVTGHTKCYVLLRRRNEHLQRYPHNLQVIEEA